MHMPRGFRSSTVLVLASVTALLLAACHPGGAGDKGAAASAPSPYATISTGKIDVEGGIVEVAARSPGVIREVLVQEGATVRKGQVLARQEDDEFVLAANSARAAVAQAQSQLALTQVNLRTA